MKVIYAGSFDPVTNGHLDIIKRAKKIFGEVIVAVLNNTNKKGLFTVEERKDLLRQVLVDEDNITIDSFEGLLVDYAISKGCKVIVRGLRSASDYINEYTLSMANMNYKDGVETVFLMASGDTLFISSTMAKEVAQFDGDLSMFVPDVVAKSLKEKLLK